MKTVFFSKGEGSVQELCETWYEWMIGKLLYTKPFVKYYSLAVYAEEAISEFGGLETMTTLDSVLSVAFEIDIPQVSLQAGKKFDIKAY